MYLVHILAALSAMNVVRSAPTPTYRRKDYELIEHPELLLVEDINELENGDAFESDLDRGAGTARVKRLGSLSIVNPVDVLRERVLLELARRKMRQNQKQVDANRRLLQSIGKRAASNSVDSRVNSNEQDNYFSEHEFSKPSKELGYAYYGPKTDFKFGIRLSPEQKQQQRYDQSEWLTSERSTDREDDWEERAENSILQ